MALYCSREIFEALDGMPFPATRDDLLDHAEAKDAREAVIVVLNELPEDVIFHDVSEVCENARTVCNLEVVRFISRAMFPAKREQLIEFAERNGASESVKNAIFALPSGYTFSSVDEMCEYVL